MGGWSAEIASPAARNDPSFLMSLLQKSPHPIPLPRLGRGEAHRASSPPAGERMEVRGIMPTGAPRAHEVLRGSAATEAQSDTKGTCNLKKERVFFGWGWL